MSLHAVRRRGCRGARSTPARWCGLRTIASGSLSESCVRSSASARTSGRSQAVHVSSYSCSTCTCAQLACMHWCRQAGVTPFQDGCVQRSTVSAVADSLWKYDHSASASFLSAFACTARLKVRVSFLQGCWRIDARSLGMYHCLRGPGCSGGYCPVSANS